MDSGHSQKPTASWNVMLLMQLPMPSCWSADACKGTMMWVLSAAISVNPDTTWQGAWQANPGSKCENFLSQQFCPCFSHPLHMCFLTSDASFLMLTIAVTKGDMLFAHWLRSLTVCSSQIFFSWCSCACANTHTQHKERPSPHQ